MKRYTQTINYSDESLKQLQKYENLIESLLTEFHSVKAEINQLREEEKQKTVRFKELFGRKLFLSFILEKVIEMKILDKDALL